MFTLYQQWLLVILIGVIIGVIIWYRSNNLQAPNLHQYQPQTIVYKDELDLWLDKLETFENCPPEGIKDHNGLMSYGGLCFQMPTFKQYVLKYIPDSKEWEEADWLNNIMDTDFQKIIARKMILENYNNWRHWFYSIAIRHLPKPPRY